MQVHSLEMPLVKPHDDIENLVIGCLTDAGVRVEDHDVIVVASKVIATAENRIVNLKAVEPSQRAAKLALKYGMDPAHVEVIIRESDWVLGGIHKTLITLKNGVLIANGGVDKSNAPSDHVILWPSDPDRWAVTLHDAIKRKLNASTGIVVADSRVHPLRIGTIGCAIGVAGFDPIREYRGVIDLFAKPLLISRLAVADDLASAAHVLMGEAAERKGMVLIKGAPIEDSSQKSSKDMLIPPDQCLFMGSIFKYPRELSRLAKR